MKFADTGDVVMERLDHILYRRNLPIGLSCREHANKVNRLVFTSP